MPLPQASDAGSGEGFGGDCLRKHSGGLSVKEEIARIREALGSEDEDALAEYGGF